MVRSLWSGASGMKAQQVNVDTIANNLANVNTTGFKTQSAEFKSLLYQTIKTKSTTTEGVEKPVGVQVGLGVRNSSISTHFSQGSFLSSDNNFAMAISGSGFFGIRNPDGTTYYTRNGNFNLSIGTNGMTLCDTEGNPVLDSGGEAIVLDADIIASRVTLADDGTLYYPDGDGVPQSLNVTIGLWQFQNTEGLDKVGDTKFMQSAASGEPVNEAENDNVKKSSLVQGYLEGSNVSVADEMVNLIVAQRAYEINSKAITTSDEMLQTANSLKK